MKIKHFIRMRKIAAISYFKNYRLVNMQYSCKHV